MRPRLLCSERLTQAVAWCVKQVAPSINAERFVAAIPRELLQRIAGTVYRALVDDNGAVVYQPHDTASSDAARTFATRLAGDMRRIIASMSFVLNLDPRFTHKYLGWSGEDDREVYNGTGNLYRYDAPVAGPSNSSTAPTTSPTRGYGDGTLRINLTAKLAQACAFAEEVVYERIESGPSSDAFAGFIAWVEGILIHELLHGVQYYYQPVTYVDTALADLTVGVDYAPGLLPATVLELAGAKNRYEDQGFGVTRSFRRGREASMMAFYQRFVEYLERRPAEFAQGSGRYPFLSAGNPRDFAEVYLRAMRRIRWQTASRDCQPATGLISTDSTCPACWRGSCI